VATVTNLFIVKKRGSKKFLEVNGGIACETRPYQKELACLKDLHFLLEISGKLKTNPTYFKSCQCPKPSN
tara:strand:- start:294 stop:503 length:210 start_codon:yes stop_codon:yes gene_type:complete